MTKGTGAERVRRHRARRKNFGVVEIRVWVRAEDRQAALEAVAPFNKAARQHMSRRFDYDDEKEVPGWVKALPHRLDQ